MSSCPQCEASGLDHDTIVAECLSSPYWAGLHLANFDWFKNPLHQAIDQWYMQKLDEGAKRVLILLPRGHMKTHYFGIATMLWRMINNPEDRILYIMSSCTQSEKSIKSLCDILVSSESLRHFFPDRVLDLSNPTHKGTKDVIRLTRSGTYREESAEARGITSRIVGGHFNRHIFDDLIDETMVDSEQLQEKSINFVKRAQPLFVTPEHDDRTIIGTRWPGPFYNWLLEPGGISDKYEKVVLGCYVDDRYRRFLASIGKATTQEDGDPIWPEHFSKESLAAIRVEMGDFDFAHQYLNVEVSDADRQFRKEDIRYYTLGATKYGEQAAVVNIEGQETIIPVDSMYRTLTLDPATGEHDKTDESAISVCGECRKTGLKFVLEDWAGRPLPLDLIDKTIDMADKWQVHKVGPEDVSFQKTFKHFLTQRMRERGVYFSIVPVKPGPKSKGARIAKALQPFVQSHQLHFLKSQWQLVNELLNMQIIGGKVIGRSPNRIDALAYHPTFWRGGPSYRDTLGDDDMDYLDQFQPEVSPAYGLACTT